MRERDAVSESSHQSSDLSAFAIGRGHGSCAVLWGWGDQWCKLLCARERASWPLLRCTALRCALLRHSSQFENTFFKSYIFANKMTKKRGGLEDVKKERSVLDVEVSVFNAACRWFIQPHLSLHSHSIVEQSRQFILSAPLR